MFEGFNLADGPYINHVFNKELHLGQPPGNPSAPIDEVKYNYLNIGSGPGHQPPGGVFVLSPTNGNLTGGVDGLYPSWDGSYTPIDNEIYERLSANIDWNWQTNPVLNEPPTLEQQYDFYIRYANSYSFIEAIPGGVGKYVSTQGGVKFYFDKKLSKESIQSDIQDGNIVGAFFYDQAIMSASIIDGKVVFNNKNWPTGSGSGLGMGFENINISLPNQDVAISTFILNSYSVEPTKDFETAVIKSVYFHYIYYIYNNPMTKLQSTAYSSGKGFSTSLTCKSSGENFLKRFEIIFKGNSVNEFENMEFHEYDNQNDINIRPIQSFTNLIDEFGGNLGTGAAFDEILIAKTTTSLVENYPLISKIAIAQGLSADEAWSVGTIKAI